MKIKLRNELIEYLIYLLKCFSDENSSITELKYDNLAKILNDDSFGKPDDLDLEEQEEKEETQEKIKKEKKIKNPDDESDENDNDLAIKENLANNSDESGIEITTEEYLKIVEGILIELANKMHQKNLTIEEIFSEFISVVENKQKNSKTNILELKYLVNILHEELAIKLDSVDIYCLFTKFKVDENEIEEIIDFDKLVVEINNLIADPNAFFLKMKSDREENNYKNFNNENNLENLNNKGNNLENNNIYMHMKMNSLDYLRTFMKENKIDFESLIVEISESFIKNNFSGDIYVDLKIFDEFLEVKNLFSRNEFVENLPEIFSNESIRMALLTKDNKINLSFLKQILDETGKENIPVMESPVKIENFVVNEKKNLNE